MSTIQFGFFEPDQLDFNPGDISVSTLDGLKQKVDDVMHSGLLARDWFYAPPAASKDFMSGQSSNAALQQSHLRPAADPCAPSRQRNWS